MPYSHPIARQIAGKMKLLSLAIAISATTAAQLHAAPVETIPLKSLPQNTRLDMWGDSITEVTLYPRYVETYLLACAGRKDVKCFTLGHSGETLSGIISRESDLAAFKPTMVSFEYGMNDTQYTPYTPDRGATFDKTIHAVLALLKAHGIKQVVIIGPSIADDSYLKDNPAAFFHGADPAGLTAAQAQNITLGHFHDIARAAAVENGYAYADIYDRMVDAYTAAKKVLGPSYCFAVGGGIHPSPNGHLMIACEVLKALACDGAIGTIDVDMTGSAHASEGHRIVSASNGMIVIDSTRYPFCVNYDAFGSTQPDSPGSIAPFTPLQHDLNRFILKVSHLAASSAAITWGDTTKTFTREQLAAGINLPAEFPHTPFDATFGRVIDAVGDKQNFENFMIKGTSNYNGNDNGGNPDLNMIALQEQKDAAVKGMIVPVRHTIVITPAGETTAATPVIAGTLMVYATAGIPLDYKPIVLHDAASFSAADLPSGLTLKPTTGEITGSIAKPGIYPITLSATNARGTGSNVVTLTVDPPLPDYPSITSPATATATVGQPFAYQIQATANPTNYFATSPGATGTEPPASSLPPGITYDTTTGVLSGTPTIAGSYPIQIAALNARMIATKLITLTVNAK